MTADLRSCTEMTYKWQNILRFLALNCRGNNTQVLKMCFHPETEANRSCDKSSGLKKLMLLEQSAIIGATWLTFHSKAGSYSHTIPQWWKSSVDIISFYSAPSALCTLSLTISCCVFVLTQSIIGVFNHEMKFHALEKSRALHRSLLQGTQLVFWNLSL